MRHLIAVGLLAVAYVVAGSLGLLLAIPPGNVTLLWPASGIALAAILLGGDRLWPGIWVGSFLVNVPTLFAPGLAPSLAASLAAGVGIATGSTLQALAGGRLILKLTGARGFPDQPRGVFRFAAAAALMCLIGSTFGATSLATWGFVARDAYPFAWRTWYLGDLAGVLVYAPLLMVWLRRSPVRRDAGAIAEAAAFLGLSTLTTLVVFGGWLPAGASASYLAFPISIWAAFRFGRRGATAAICFVAAMASWGTARGAGPFQGGSLQLSLLLLQAFVSVLAVSSLTLATVVKELRRVAGALDELNGDLERRVADRSALAEQRAEQLALSERACQEKGRTLRSVLDGILEGVVVADRRGEVILWNRAAERLLGVDIRDVPPGRWPSHYGCFLPDRITPYPAGRFPLARAIRGETVQAEDMFLRNPSRPDGLWLQHSAVPLRDEAGGEPAGGVAVFRDVSEGKQAELRLRSVIESALAGFVMVDEAGRIVLVNRQAEVIFGYDREELHGRPIEVLMPEPPREGHRRDMEAYFRDPRARPMAASRDVRGLGKDGRIIHLLVALNPIRQDGRLLVLASVLDVTEQRRAAGLVRSVVEFSPDGTVAVDRGGRIVLVNREAERMFGYAREELLGQPLGILVPERARDRHRALAERFVAEHGRRSMNRGSDLFARRKDGTEFPADIALYSYELNGASFAVANVRDMTERRRLTAEVQAHLLGQGVISQVLRMSLEPAGVDELLRRSLDLVLSLPWFAAPAAGGVFLAEGEGDALVPKAQRGLPPEILGRCAAPHPGRCPCGDPDRHREVAFAGGPGGSGEPRLPLYCAPIFHGERHGILIVLLDESHPRRPDEEEFLSSVARILAGTIERKRGEDALRGSEARFRAISETAPLGIFLTDAAGGILYTNRAYLELAGRRDGEPPGGDWREAIHPEDRDRVRAEWDRSARDRSPFESTYRILHRDGRTTWASAKSAEIRIGDALTGYVGVVEDVTQKRRVIEAIRRSEERFDLAVRGTDAGIWDWDLVTGSIYFSPRWKSMLGHAEDEVASSFAEWESRLHPDDRDRASRAIKDYLEGRTAEYELEHRLRHKDGTYRWILSRGAAVRDGDGRPYRMVGSHIDITAQRRMAEQLSENLAQLEVAQRIQQAMLPRQSPAIAGLDIAGVSHPADYAGGDMFNYLPMLDGRLGIVIGDVAGHGIGAALEMASTQAFLRGLAQTCSTLGEIMTRINRFVFGETEGESFITLLLIRWDPRTRSLTYANAGHPPGYILDPAGEVRAELGSSSLPLGLEEHSDFPVGEPIALRPGELVVLVTDGILEAASPDEVFFGSGRLLEVIRGARGRAAREILEELHRAVTRHTGTEVLKDDVTAVVIKLGDASGPS
ncbi:Phosphoserine phosphatase RsbU [Aquisphaera giovannonii]|uniref:histidine kinase n=1 Tax=Aquisphaera giovannonii TaxID=406548 RepID=A0A5B9W6I1_9BACT|nr:PAS domain S-box protein [Aquisphaera giovannonii]QEH35769.1 Phosphoserine phosphatase RsbU [Aquisphaera giovannonii]